ncbi:MAG TPA: hypothetical protein VK203_23730 [Nostocaceae cyanobacterium]|nr:hypothetical protein [Nostocaceae cyanobacterium]
MTYILALGSSYNYEISGNGLGIVPNPCRATDKSLYADQLTPVEAKKLAIAILAQDFNILSDHLSTILDRQLIHQILHQAQSIQKLGLGLDDGQTIKVLEQLIKARLFDKNGVLDAELVGEKLADIINQALDDNQPKIKVQTSVGIDLETLVTQVYTQYLASKKTQEELAKINQQRNLDKSISQFIQELDKILNPQISQQLENLSFLPIDELNGNFERFSEEVNYKLIQAEFTYCHATFQIESLMHGYWKISLIQESFTGCIEDEYRESFEVQETKLQTDLLIVMGEIRARLEAHLQKSSEQNLQPC